MSKTTQQIQDELNSKIPRSAVSEREGSGGKTFSYLTAHYVIDRMNKVFGQGGWNMLTEEIRLVHAGEVTGKYGSTHTAHYIARVRIETPALGGGVFTDVGYGDGSDKVNPGKAHELAAKEAVSDAFKRAARNLGMSMGLALYSKEQENVDDGEEQPKSAGKNNEGTAKEGAGDVRGAEASALSQAAPVSGQVPKSAGSEAVPRETVNKLISAAANKIAASAGNDKKPERMRELIQGMKAKYGVGKKEELTDEQAASFLADLRGQLQPTPTAAAAGAA